jgi:hypothetical protein
MPRGGQRPGAGRKRGSTSISTTLVREFLATKNFDPISKLVELYEHEETDHATKVKIATELAQYVAPKLKAVDVQGRLTQERITVVLGVPPRQMDNAIEVPARDLLAR